MIGDGFTLPRSPPQACWTASPAKASEYQDSNAINVPRAIGRKSAPDGPSGGESSLTRSGWAPTRLFCSARTLARSYSPQARCDRTLPQRLLLELNRDYPGNPLFRTELARFNNTVGAESNRALVIAERLLLHSGSMICLMCQALQGKVTY
jgi:hypothetical protein